jgi:hypothetical protein
MIGRGTFNYNTHAQGGMTVVHVIRHQELLTFAPNHDVVEKNVDGAGSDATDETCPHGHIVDPCAHGYL